MTKTIVIAVGDLHVNSTVALCKPSINLDDDGTYRASNNQRKIWDAWLDFCNEVKAIDADKRILVLNGDIGELDTKRRSVQLITLNKATVLRMVIDTIEPMLSIIDDVIVVRGTMAHVGKSSWLEESIADDIGAISNGNAKSHWHFRGMFENVRFDIAHHASMGNLPWTEKAAAIKIAKIIMDRYNEMKSPIPHVALRSHNHRRSDSGRNYECRAVCLPCWQLHTEYISRIGHENSIADIGGDIFVCEDGSYKWIDYRYEINPSGRRLWSLKV